MKKILFVLMAFTVLLSSCATVIGGLKKNIFLIDLPPDLTVTSNNVQLEIKNQLVGSSESGGTRTRYLYPGVRLRMKKGLKLELKSGAKTAVVPVKVRYKSGDIIIGTIMDLFFTFGAGLIVDIADGAFKTPKERFIDVPALLNNEKPRSQKVLHDISRGIQK